MTIRVRSPTRAKEAQRMKEMRGPARKELFAKAAVREEWMELFAKPAVPSRRVIAGHVCVVPTIYLAPLVKRLALEPLLESAYLTS